MHKLGFLTVILIISLTLTSCQLAKMGGDAKKNPPDPRLRVKKNLEEGKGFRLMDIIKIREVELLNLQVQMSYGELHLIQLILCL